MTPRLLLTAALAFPLHADEPPVVVPPPCCAGNSRTAAIAADLFARPDSWVFADAAAWKWSGTGAARTLALVAQNRVKPVVRQPFNLAWFDGAEWKDFTLTAELRLTKFDDGNNDLCIAFGRSGENRFYYVHLGEKADEPHHQIHLVNDADRKPVTTWRTTGTPWEKDRWHRVKIVRNSATGDIGVWFDDMKRPVLTARDRTLEWGRIGLGSFDDLGEFRQVEVKGVSRKIE
jgi:hypothetical protein